MTRTLLTTRVQTCSARRLGARLQLEQGFRLKNVRIIGLVTHPPHNNFTSRLDRKFWNEEQETNPKKINPTQEFALKHIKRVPDLYHKSQPENLYGIMRWHG